MVCCSLRSKISKYKPNQVRPKLLFMLFTYCLCNCNRNCYQNYLDYHRCQKVKGADYEPCEWFKKVYKTLCPRTWVSCNSLESVVLRIINFSMKNGMNNVKRGFFLERFELKNSVGIDST